MNQIEPVFILFPSICLLLSLSREKNDGVVKCLVSLSFILVYCLSLNGSDLESYGILYAKVQEGRLASEIHGEFGFYLLMKAFVHLGVDYIYFRIIMLSFVSIILFLITSKVSTNFPLSVFFISAMFPIYTISAYRQYIVMVFSMVFILDYSRGHMMRAIVETSVLLIFHVTAILPLACLIVMYFRKERLIDGDLVFFRQKIFALILAAVILRITVFALMKIPMISKFVVLYVFAGHLAYGETTLLSFGLLSRVFFLAGISYLFYYNGIEDRLTKLLYWYYVVSMLMYIAIPLELVMGRMMNNANIMLVLIIPRLLFFSRTTEGERISYCRINGYGVVEVSLFLVAFFVLLAQLILQKGYYPYNNVLLELIYS